MAVRTVRRVAFEPTFASWRAEARTLIAEAVPPAAVDWQAAGESSQMTLLAAGDAHAEAGAATARTGPKVPKRFVRLAERVALHRDTDRWRLLYRLLWRLANDEPHLMKIDVDQDVHRLTAMAKAVRRDQHKMKAFVRFRRIEDDDGDAWFVAWYRPDHRIVSSVAPFFAERFNDQRWSILTPDGSASWNLDSLRFGPGAPRESAPAGDQLELLWRTYYASIFNPARVKVRAMKAEMPVRYWSTLPEASLIPALLRDAPGRVQAMVDRPRRPTARDAFPEQLTVQSLAAALPGCRACALCENGTAPVPGVGPADAATVLVGEQPGDVEARRGRPFVGPAGAVLDRALQAAGFDRDRLFLTNAVKHFKFATREGPRGKERIHKTPGLTEVSSCMPWLRQEIACLQPRVLVLMGATAARAMLGAGVRLRRDRGQPIATPHSPWTIVTYHPSALLRIPDPAARRRVEDAFFADLALAGAHARTVDPSSVPGLAGPSCRVARKT